MKGFLKEIHTLRDRAAGRSGDVRRGGVLVDRVFEPLMAAAPPDGLAVALLGTGKGSGAALLFAALWALGLTTCLLFRRDQAIRRME